jgi:hypothetical protein
VPKFRVVVLMLSLFVSSSCAAEETRKIDIPQILLPVSEAVTSPDRRNWGEVLNSGVFPQDSDFVAANKWLALGAYLEWRKKSIDFSESAKVTVSQRADWFRVNFQTSSSRIGFFAQVKENKISDLRWFDNFSDKFQEVEFFHSENEWLSGDIGFVSDAVWQIGNLGCFNGSFMPRTVENASSLEFELSALTAKNKDIVIKPGPETFPKMISGVPRQVGEFNHFYWSFTACYPTLLTEVETVHIPPNQLKFQSNGNWLKNPLPVVVDLGLSKVGLNLTYPDWFSSIEQDDLSHQVPLPGGNN